MGSNPIVPSKKMRPIRELLFFVENKELRDSLLRMYDDCESDMKKWPASTRKHHSWPGGYYDHVQEVMEFGIILHRTLCTKKFGVSDISLDDVILCTFLHDWEKLTKYDIPIGWKKPITDPQKDMINRLIKQDKIQFDGNIDDLDMFHASRMISKALDDKDPAKYTYTKDLSFESTGWIATECSKYNINLNRKHLHALSWSHGAWSIIASSPYSYANDMSPLALLVHTADMLSCKLYGEGRNVGTK